MPEALAVTSRTNESLALLWLALSLTEGLGPKRGRSLVEHLGGVQNVFKASLTELEAAGIRAVSAQSWQPAVHGVSPGRIGTRDRRRSFSCLPRRSFVSGGAQANLRSAAGSLRARKCGSDYPAGHGGGGHASSHALRPGNGRTIVVRSGGPGTGHLQRPGARRGRAAHRGAINAKGERSPFSAQEWTSFIRRRTRA